jgi:3-hydroxybutyryl-CoA dehydrogenase
MVIAILADDGLKEEFLSKGIPSHIEIIWADSVQSLRIIEADVYIDLLFENDHERISRLRHILPKPVIVNSVTYTGKDIGAPFIRINAWPSMLKRNIAEVAATAGDHNESIKNFFDELGWKYQVVSDTMGMVTPRVISMIINEAFFALSDEISTREEIDTAMKLGTNYPYGPFEWGEKIGMERVCALLAELNRTDPRYAVAPLLIENKTQCH